MPIRRLLIANRGEIAVADRPHRARAAASRQSRSSPTPTPRAAHRARPTSRSGCPGRACRHLPARRPDHRRRRAAPARTRSILATASCPRTRLRPRRAPRPGSIFVGPRPAAIAAMGSKLAAKELMAAAGVPVLPGGESRPGAAGATWPRSAPAVGFPLLVKASSGGGGRGMRLVTRSGEPGRRGRRGHERSGRRLRRRHGLPRALRDRPAHVEVQILGDSFGQRGPSVRAGVLHPAALPEDRRGVAVARGRRRAPRPNSARPRFAPPVPSTTPGPGRSSSSLAADGAVLLPRGQHPPSGRAPGHRAGHRPRPGRAAAADRGRANRCRPRSLAAAITGHAIEVRLYAEDVPAGFIPATGTLHAFEIPAGDGVRVDAGYAAGSAVSPHYDAMLAKVIGYGRTRTEAAMRLERALRGARVHGVMTNRSCLRRSCAEPQFLAGADRHRLPEPARPGRALGARSGRHCRACAGGDAGQAGRQPGRRAGASDAAVGLAQRQVGPAHCRVHRRWRPGNGPLPGRRFRGRSRS